MLVGSSKYILRTGDHWCYLHFIVLQFLFGWLSQYWPRNKYYVNRNNIKIYFFMYSNCMVSLLKWKFNTGKQLLFSLRIIFNQKIQFGAKCICFITIEVWRSRGRWQQSMKRMSISQLILRECQIFYMTHLQCFVSLAVTEYVWLSVGYVATVSKCIMAFSDCFLWPLAEIHSIEKGLCLCALHHTWVCTCLGIVMHFNGSFHNPFLEHYGSHVCQNVCIIAHLQNYKKLLLTSSYLSICLSVRM
jgi:hypothetical protein